MVVPWKPLGHFLAWLIIPSIIFFYFNDVMYWYAVIGSLLVLGIYYIAFFRKRMALPALAGLALAFAISHFIL